MAGAAKPGDKAGGEVVRLRPVRPCPICAKPSARATYPFCSKRCADVDLNRWLSGSYAIPATEDEPSSEPEAEPDDDK